MKEKQHSAFDIAKADDKELQEIMENVAKSAENLLSELQHPLFEHSLYQLLGLHKELMSISGLLKVEMAKKVQLEEHIEREKCKLIEICNNPV